MPLGCAEGERRYGPTATPQLTGAVPSLQARGILSQANSPARALPPVGLNVG
jgi:hypothetical protein